ncbi:hypothetical protein E4N62_41185 [Streptomyces sp. MNU76]|nr:hypothetical protein [Streptomyces sp. MNU76]
MREAERAETDVTGSERRRHDGEEGDAITPNERAQEESSQHDQYAPREHRGRYRQPPTECQYR